ncbi:YbbR domain-containing protein [Peptostreptococcus russellii]|uniref:YbbR domain-containing protein n=1 Tax=Peptostreptococcus russellii TaxID=215200 RepID=A0A1H8HFK7_9FIRM|nr:CdaR family protein [Peptostreptococcus russellii]SEN55061.1 YbbR domain-containing protein [Peptostreptococcus russellii]
MKNNDRRNNIKTKIISLLTAIALWLYVIAVVDPDEKKVIENIPITITNANEVLKDDFVIYPKEDFKTDITVQGKLSEIQKLNKNNVHIYGELINPVEGQNIVNLRTNISNRVSRELKDNTFVVDLEKKISKTVELTVDVPPAMKDSVEEVDPEVKEIEVSGPRSLVNKVDKAVAVLNYNEERDKDEARMELKVKAVDKDNKAVDVELSQKTVKVDVKYTVEKLVPVKLNYDGEEFNVNEFTVTPEKLTVRGRADLVNGLEYIYTERLGDKELKGDEDKKVKIEIPENTRIKGDISEVTISRK